MFSIGELLVFLNVSEYADKEESCQENFAILQQKDGISCISWGDYSCA